MPYLMYIQWISSLSSNYNHCILLSSVHSGPSHHHQQERFPLQDGQWPSWLEEKVLHTRQVQRLPVLQDRNGEEFNPATTIVGCTLYTAVGEGGGGGERERERENVCVCVCGAYAHIELWSLCYSIGNNIIFPTLVLCKVFAPLLSSALS